VTTVPGLVKAELAARDCRVYYRWPMHGAPANTKLVTAIIRPFATFAPHAR